MSVSTRRTSSSIRIGQSKVPYSFENLQSSSNRLPLDRADATNSANANERDLGVFFMWAPKPIRDRFNSLVNDGLKGSGDYGVFAIGAFNGQTANRAEANNNLHVVARLSYPFAVGTQIIEPSVAAYSGTICGDRRSTDDRRERTLGLELCGSARAGDDGHRPEALWTPRRIQCRRGGRSTIRSGIASRRGGCMGAS